jgi:uncharacterized protein
VSWALFLAFVCIQDNITGKFLTYAMFQFYSCRNRNHTMLTSPHVLPILLLIASNVFMTFAWYGHLKFASSPLWIAVLASWSIAFIEYWFAVPANRIGHQVYSAAELKTMQEVITLIVFSIFSVCWLKEAITLNHVIGFVLIACGAAVIFKA